MALMVSAALAAGAVSCSKGPEIIPKRQMEKIYHDMFLADQWLEDTQPGSISRYSRNTATRLKTIGIASTITCQTPNVTPK